MKSRKLLRAEAAAAHELPYRDPTHSICTHNSIFLAFKAGCEFEASLGPIEPQIAPESTQSGSNGPCGINTVEWWQREAKEWREIAQSVTLKLNSSSDAAAFFDITRQLDQAKQKLEATRTTLYKERTARWKALREMGQAIHNLHQILP